MTKFKDINFTTKDIITGIGALVFVGTMWVDLKTDQVKHTEEHKLINYRLQEVERCCNIAAIKPKELKLKDENNQNRSARD